MEKTPITADFPLRPIGEGETLVQVFRSAAERSAAEHEHEGPPSATPRPLRERQGGLPPLQRRLYEADGEPVRFGGYDVIRCVGSGGMGIVYEATHATHGQRVALKTLRWMTATGLTRFKHEFRALCGVAHPNLVGLYELGADGGEWFFTMELVEGRSFLEHVQADGERPAGGWEYLGETLDVSMAPSRSDEAAMLDESGVVARRTFHEGRLRAALRQLASGVARLHQLGKLHRDLNPGNVLVTREGRVVVLDFGLISERERRLGWAYDVASGTPAYMSPEQAAGKPATTASDWYGFGVMLFEALTGQLPFTGSTLRLLTNKRLHAAPAPSQLVAGLPPDLDALCAALLRRAPEHRPTGDEVLCALGATPRRAQLPVPGGDAFFAGRRAELAALDEALAAAAAGRPAAVTIRGPAGIGKSRLLARFLDGVATADPLVLSGECHERETIPFRLLDGAVDALAAHLGALSPPELRAVLPAGAGALARVFPVLEGLPAAADLPPAAGEGGDAGEIAFACLREILARLAASRPVVVTIDDAHLGDHEGARRLAGLAGVPGVLLVVVHAGPGEGPSPALSELSRCPALQGSALRDLVLGPLAAGEALALARRLLPAEHPDADTAAEAIAAASGGSPLAVEELALHVADAEGEISLDEAVGARLGGLTEPARRMAEVVALAPRPVERGLLFALAGAGPSGDAALASLSARRVVRADGVRDGDRVRVHDELLRAVIAGRTPLAVARRIHLELAQALAEHPGADPAEAAECFARAGEAGLAAAHLSAAAERAATGGDPGAAAELWGRALALTPRGGAEARALSRRRADALVAAGRSAAAAGAYLEGIAGAPPAEELDRRRRAAEQLLIAGHAEEGLAALRQVLAAHGVRWPETPRAALWRLGARVVELRLRGADLSQLRRSPPAEGTGAARRRVEALWSAGRGLSLIDPQRSAALTAEALLGALAEGDAGVAAPALAFLGSVLVYPGSPAEEARGLALVEEAARFGRASGDAYLLGFSWFCSGLARLAAGRFREALARVEEGIGLLEGSGAPLAWERQAYAIVCLKALFALGSLRERARRAEAWLDDARRREDRTGEAQALLAAALAVLGAGDAAAARAKAAEARALSWPGGFGIPHYAALWLEVAILLHAGDAAAARGRLLAAWPALRDAQLHRIQLVRVEALLLRGLTAVACGGAELRLAEADAARLARERRPHALAAAALLRAGIAARRGKVEVAVSGLAAAARGYASAEMMVHAAAARRARGALLGGAEGRALVTESDALLAAEGVRDGARWAAMYTGIGV